MIYTCIVRVSVLSGFSFAHPAGRMPAPAVYGQSFSPL